MLRAIIIDDEQAGVTTLKLMLEKHASGIRIVAVTTEPEEGIKLIEDYRPDVVFLDISMPGLSGFDLLEKITYKDFRLIFTTAHEEFALSAIKNNAFDYILKPIDPEELKICIVNLLNDPDSLRKVIPAKTNSPGMIELSVKDGIIFIKQQDIVRLEASGSYTVFYLEGHVKHMASRSLKEYEIHLNESVFFRCHNSHIVNLTKVEKFVNHEGFFAQMSDGSMADISKKNKEVFLERLKSI
jgi:two-component system, LytTR family, response regulator